MLGALRKAKNQEIQPHLTQNQEEKRQGVESQQTEHQRTSDHAVDPRRIFMKAGKKYLQWIASAAQSEIFNAVLDYRMAHGLLHHVDIGDVCQTERGASFIVTADDLSDCRERAQAGEISTTGPLPGYGGLQPSQERLLAEQSWSAHTQLPWQTFAQDGVLSSHGDRRPLTIKFLSPAHLSADTSSPQSEDQSHYWLEVGLPSGSYATELLAACGIALPTHRSGNI